MGSVKTSVLRLSIAAASAALVLMSQGASAGGIKWDPVKDLTGKNANRWIKDRGTNLQNQVNGLLTQPFVYLEKLPASVLADICSAPAQWFGGTLAGQADGRWKALPPQLVAALQSQYQGVNLSAVRYAENINTGFSEGMTFGNQIYFPKSIDLTDRGDLQWMLHELEHTGQYGRSPSQAATLCEYEAKGIGSGFNHDRINMERAAIAKAAYLIDYAYGIMNPEQSQSTAQVAHNEYDSPAANQVVVSNDTDQVIYFSLQTASAQYTQFSLAPHTENVYTGENNENWFNVAIVTNGVTVQRGVDGGTVQSISVSQQGVLDVFQQ